MKKPADNVLAPRDLDRVVQRYRERIAQSGPTFESLKSGSPEKQALRCEIHATALRTPNPAVLDIGCGIGFFYSYLKGSKIGCNYTGYDVVPEYVAECRRLYPEASFEQRNVFRDGIGGTFDTVVMSQVLNNRYAESDNWQVMQTAMALAFEHSRVSVSIDMMSTRVDFQISELFYYEPAEVFRYAQTIAPRVLLRHDYRGFEFTVQLFHAAAPGYIR